jgi:aldose sugar dehydrogenase
MHRPLPATLCALFAVAALLALGECSNAHSPLASPVITPAVEPLPEGVIVETVLANITSPVSLAAEGERLLYTELGGAVRLYENGALRAQPVITLTGGFTGGQGCIDRRLIGIALDPAFNSNRYIYVSITDPISCEEAVNKVIRFTERDGVGTGPTAVFTSTQTGTVHGINSIAFGPDGKLYVSIGDNHNAPNAQDVGVKAGKIHRINPDGTIPADNPTFTQTGALPSLYAMGLRNSFDLAFDTVGGGVRLFASENGPECDDEMNLIRGGHNYGWRADYPCDDPQPDPIYNTHPPLWYTSTAVAPTGIEVYARSEIGPWRNSLFMCNYQDSTLRRFMLSPDRTRVTGVTTIEGVGCNMDVATGPDGALYYIEGGGYAPGSIKRLRMVEPTACLAMSGQIVPSPNLTNTLGPEADTPPPYNTLRSISALSPTQIWAVGNYRRGENYEPLTMRWDGGRWVAHTILGWPQSENAYLMGVQAVSEGEAWAVGYYERQGETRTLTLRWNGSEWERWGSPSPGSAMSHLRGIDASSPANVWAVGYYTDTIASENTVRPLLIRWDTSGWRQVPGPDFGPDIDARLIGVEVLGENDVWAVGNLQPTPSGMEETLILHYNGTSWTRVPSPNVGGTLNFLRGVAGTASDDVWAVGYYGTPSRAHLLHWDGVRWSSTTAPAAGEQDFLIDVEAVATDNVVAVGNSIQGGVEKTVMMRHDGSEWRVVGTPNASVGRNYFFGVTAAGPNEIWSAGFYEDGSTMHTLTARFTPTEFSDVPPGSTFYPQIMCLVCRGIVSGYADGTFRPNADVTRGQLSKIVAASAGFSEPPGEQLFEDVPPGSTFYDWINRLARRGHIGGYPCGGAGEPCGPDNLPYFRPNANATRGQISKIVSNAAGFSEGVSGQTYHDVSPDNPFYLWIERLSGRGIMSGYGCGGPGEPCDPENRPYFRWANNATRGQTSKIVANAFFPGCRVR